MELTEERVLQELVEIGFARAEDYLVMENGQPRLRDAHNMAAVAMVETTSKGIKVRFYDKLKALELLGKYLGLFSGVGGQVEENNLLEVLMAAAEREDAYDLPELKSPAAAGDDLVEETEISTS